MRRDRDPLDVRSVKEDRAVSAFDIDVKKVLVLAEINLRIVKSEHVERLRQLVIRVYCRVAKASKRQLPLDFHGTTVRSRRRL